MADFVCKKCGDIISIPDCDLPDPKELYCMECFREVLKEGLMAKLEKLEGEEQYDYHPFLHELIVDYLFENFDIKPKP